MKKALAFEMKHLLRKYEAATLLPWSTHELLCNFARMKRSARFSLRVPKARFIGGSPALFFMRFGALHWKKQVLRLAFFLAPRTGLEPVTSWLTVMRSTDWAIEEYINIWLYPHGVRHFWSVRVVTSWLTVISSWNIVVTCRSVHSLL